MGKKRSILSWILILIGATLFLGGFYLLPIGTDAYMYFWIEIVFKGNWLYGDIAANAVAFTAMGIGAVILWKEHASLRDLGKDIDLKKIKKRRKRK